MSLKVLQLRSSRKMTIEAHLAGVVLRPKAEYEASKEQLDDFGRDNPDGGTALFQRVLEHNHTQRKYRQALQGY